MIRLWYHLTHSWTGVPPAVECARWWPRTVDTRHLRLYVCHCGTMMSLVEYVLIWNLDAVVSKGFWCWKEEIGSDAVLCWFPWWELVSFIARDANMSVTRLTQSCLSVGNIKKAYSLFQATVEPYFQRWKEACGVMIEKWRGSVDLKNLTIWLVRHNNQSTCCKRWNGHSRNLTCTPVLLTQRWTILCDIAPFCIDSNLMVLFLSWYHMSIGCSTSAAKWTSCKQHQY